MKTPECRELRRWGRGIYCSFMLSLLSIDSTKHSADLMGAGISHVVSCIGIAWDIVDSSIEICWQPRRSTLPVVKASDDSVIKL